MWQGKDEWEEEGVGVEEDQAATLAHTEQVRATQSNSRRAGGSDEVTKAARTQGTSSAQTSSSSSSSSSSSDSG